MTAFTFTTNRTINNNQQSELFRPILRTVDAERSKRRVSAGLFSTLMVKTIHSKENLQIV